MSAASLGLDLVRLRWATNMRIALHSTWHLVTRFQDPALTIGAAILAVFAHLLSVPNAILAVVATAAMSIDMIAGVLSSIKGKTFSSAKLFAGVIGKMLRVSIVLLAALIDVGLATVLPHEGATAVILDTTPTTKLVLLAAFIAESLSILAKVEMSEGNILMLKPLRRSIGRLQRHLAESEGNMSRDKDDSSS